MSFKNFFTKRARIVLGIAGLMIGTVIVACGGGVQNPAAEALNEATRQRTLGVATGTALWTGTISEDTRFYLPSSYVVRYGKGTAWTSMTLPAGEHQCSGAVFGSDPAPGVAKICQVKNWVDTLPPPLPAGSWKRIALRDANHTLTNVSIIRYGNGINWRYSQDSGLITCSPGYFSYYGSLPFLSECQMFVPAVVSSPMPTGMGGPDIDVAKIPPFAVGYDQDYVKYTDELPADSNDGTGAFRNGCAYSHMAFDDPIVKPGQPGMSHLHTFFGNTGVNASSTAESIATTGNSTCRGGTVNRTGYWVPTMIDTKNGTPLIGAAGLYYKTGYAGIAPAQMTAFPPGLRVIAGSASNSQPGGPIGFKCQNGGEELGEQFYIPNCPLNSELWMNITFPQCWNGVDLDSPDHKSHMAYPVDGACPAGFPVAFPEISYHIIYKVKQANAPKRWRLSSDVYSNTGPAGYSSHGDWFNGWKPAIMDLWVANCEVAAKDCHSHLLGNNLEIYEP